jgi:hypothetical protein
MLNITCPGGPCGYDLLTTDFRDLMGAALSLTRFNKFYFFTPLFIAWLVGFILCYLIYSIAEAFYGMLRKSKKALSK